MRLGGEEGVGRVEIGRVLERVIGAVRDCDGRDDEGRDAGIENRHSELEGGK